MDATQSKTKIPASLDYELKYMASTLEEMLLQARTTNAFSIYSGKYCIQKKNHVQPPAKQCFESTRAQELNY